MPYGMKNMVNKRGWSVCECVCGGEGGSNGVSGERKQDLKTGSYGAEAGINVQDIPIYLWLWLCDSITHSSLLPRQEGWRRGGLMTNREQRGSEGVRGAATVHKAGRGRTPQGPASSTWNCPLTQSVPPCLWGPWFHPSQGLWLGCTLPDRRRCLESWSVSGRDDHCPQHDPRRPPRCSCPHRGHFRRPSLPYLILPPAPRHIAGLDSQAGVA